MIIKAEIINKPYSGEFKERVYNIENSWNSQSWSFIKFIDDDYSEWCGQFRGVHINTQISIKNQILLVLTSDYLFQLDSKTGDITEFENQPLFKSLILTPNDDFLIADNYNIEKITKNIKNKKTIESPIPMNLIEFNSWKNNILEFTCEGLFQCNKYFFMEYNDETETILIKNVI